jgi:hypothetical protein
MVVVVPGLPQRRQRQPEHVARLVVDVEPPRTEEVAHRVHAPRHVVDEEHAHEPAPQQAGRRADQRSGQRPPGERGQEQAGEDEPVELAVDEPHAPVLAEIGSVAAPGGPALFREQPADVGVP